MKYLAYLISCISCILLAVTLLQLNAENHEITDLNLQISALESQSIADGQLIAKLKTKLIKRAHPKKKVICMDVIHVA